jgi:DNA integrity scanning protein DisA with diadenylate cyclase activity
LKLRDILSKFKVENIQIFPQRMSTIFSNIKLLTLYDTKRKKIRVRPMEGQRVPELWVSCSRKQRNQMNIGTIFKMNVKLIESERRKPYLIATKKILGQLSLF